MTSEMKRNGEMGENRPKLPSFKQLISDFNHQHQPRHFDSQLESKKLVDTLDRKDRQQLSLNKVAPNPTDGHFNRNYTIEVKEPNRPFVFPLPPNNTLLTVQSQDNLSAKDNTAAREVQVKQKFLEPSLHQRASSDLAFPPHFRHNPSASLTYHRKGSSLNSTGSSFGSGSSREVSYLRNLGPKRDISEEANLLLKIEKMLTSIRFLLGVGKDIEADLIQNSEPRGAETGDSVRLNFKHGGDGDYINFNSLRTFLANIPEQVLGNTISECEMISDSLQNWKSFRNKREGPTSVQRLPNSLAINTARLSPKRSSGNISPKNNSKRSPSCNQPLKKNSQGETIFIKVDHRSVAKSASTSSLPIKKAKGSIKPKVKPKQFGLNEELSATKRSFCVQCGETETPEWRRGPYGVRTLCNACGLFHSKLIRKLGVDEAARIMIERRHNGQGSDRRISNEEDN